MERAAKDSIYTLPLISRRNGPLTFDSGFKKIDSRVAKVSIAEVEGVKYLR